MPDFSRGKIYKITGGGLTYYGSTTLKYLSQRLSGHKQDKRRAKINCSSFQILDYPDCQITLVESCPCANVNELRARERFFIETNDCVNKCIPGRTKQESDKNYRQQNRDKIAERKKLWCEQNKDHIAEYQRYYRARQRNKLQSTSKYAESPF